MNFSNDFLIDFKLVAKATKNDESLQKKNMTFMPNGWPENLKGVSLMFPPIKLNQT